MKIVRDLEEKGATVILDDVSFINCKFTECTLIYHGGDSAWVNCQFKNCPIVLQGAAARTQNFLLGFGWKPPEKAVEVGEPENKTLLH